MLEDSLRKLIKSVIKESNSSIGRFVEFRPIKKGDAVFQSFRHELLVILKN